MLQVWIIGLGLAASAACGSQSAAPAIPAPEPALTDEPSPARRKLEPPPPDRTLMRLEPLDGTGAFDRPAEPIPPPAPTTTKSQAEIEAEAKEWFARLDPQPKDCRERHKLVVSLMRQRAKKQLEKRVFFARLRVLTAGCLGKEQPGDYPKIPPHGG